MRSPVPLRRALPFAAAILLTVTGVVVATSASAAGEPYRDPSLPVATRVADLMSRMSLDEKIGQMTQAERASITNSQITQFRIGSILSGGGSALLAAPAEGLTLADKQSVNRALLKSGASIGEMNCVRKHLSSIKGGRLALACAPARVETLLISDIPGDDPTLIASGPTLPDATTCVDALAVIDGGQVKYVRAWGYRNVEKKLPLTADTIMYGASLTKAAFAYYVLMLVDAGRLDLDATLDQLGDTDWPAGGAVPMN